MSTFRDFLEVRADNGDLDDSDLFLDRDHYTHCYEPWEFIARSLDLEGETWEDELATWLEMMSSLVEDYSDSLTRGADSRAY